MYIYDGQEYQEKKDIPNLGSIRCTNASKENVRNYILKEEDTRTFKYSYICWGWLYC